MQSSIHVDVEVEDVNDNVPAFSQQVYNISLNERGVHLFLFGVNSKWYSVEKDQQAPRLSVS